MSIDDLAIMVANGFTGIHEELEPMKKDIQELKDGQERIQLKLDNVAYRFELIEPQKRVELLEKRIGMRR